MRNDFYVTDNSNSSLIMQYWMNILFLFLIKLSDMKSFWIRKVSMPKCGTSNQNNKQSQIMQMKERTIKIQNLSKEKGLGKMEIQT